MQIVRKTISLAFQRTLQGAIYTSLQIIKAENDHMMSLTDHKTQATVE